MELVIPNAGSPKAPKKVKQNAKPDLKKKSAGKFQKQAPPKAKVRKPAALKAKQASFEWPVDGKVTSRYGKRWGKTHDGIDIGSKAGAPVKAAAAGEVLFSAEHGSYGNLVVIRHQDNLVTVYAHNQSNLVRKGQKVSRGQMIAKVGRKEDLRPGTTVELGVASEKILTFSAADGRRLVEDA